MQTSQEEDGGDGGAGTVLADHRAAAAARQEPSAEHVDLQRPVRGHGREAVHAGRPQAAQRPGHAHRHPQPGFELCFKYLISFMLLNRCRVVKL